MTISSVSSLFKFIEEFFRITWLSVSSRKFYQDLYKKYKGYGFKYITMAITITSVIYALFIFDSITMIRYYLVNSGIESNPIEYILKQWPEIKYDGKEISLENDEPVIINTINGKVAIAIDYANKLSISQRQAIPVILQKTQLIMNFVKPSDSSSKPHEMSVGYGQIFGTEPSEITQFSLKAALLDILQPLGFIALLLIIPILLAIRFVIHILGSLFSMVLLFGVLWWLNLNPTIQSVSRVVLFTSGAAEIISPLLLIFAPSLLILASLIEYWAIILAVYSLSSLNKNN